MSDTKQKTMTWAILVIIALLALNGYQFFRNNSLNTEVSATNAQLTDELAAREELQTSFEAAEAELDELKSDNTELNSLIDKQKEELRKQKNKIGKLIRSKKDLAKAREDIKNMQATADSYVAQIMALKQENQQLTSSNVKLTEERGLLQEEIQATTAIKNELEAAKNQLTEDKTILESENKNLSGKVLAASVINIEDLTVTGWKIRSGGKAASKRRAKNIDRLKICFRVKANRVVEPGGEKFYIRILDPKGEPAFIEDLGSGTTNLADNHTIKYTCVKNIEYENEELYTCHHWEPQTPFIAGEYTIEVYNKGYMTNSSKFTLK